MLAFASKCSTTVPHVGRKALMAKTPIFTTCICSIIGQLNVATASKLLKNTTTVQEGNLNKM